MVGRRIRTDDLRNNSPLAGPLGQIGFNFSHPVTVCVLFSFVDPILGNRYGPGVTSFRQ